MHIFIQPAGLPLWLYFAMFVNLHRTPNVCSLFTYPISKATVVGISFGSTKATQSREMEVVVHGQGATMFSDEELRGIANIEKGPNHIEVMCLVRSSDYGELPGKLEIKCECFPTCREGKSIIVSFNHSALLRGSGYGCR